MIDENEGVDRIEIKRLGKYHFVYIFHLKISEVESMDQMNISVLIVLVCLTISLQGFALDR